MKEQLKKVNHEIIRYANCWEDADLLVHALNIKEGERVLSIASAGDNSFSLLINNPEKVVAVDINASQLALVRLKSCAIKILSRDQYLVFLGIDKSSSKDDLVKRVIKELSDEDQEFWNAEIEWIKRGLVDEGKFEKYFRMFNSRILPLIHKKSTTKELFKIKTEEEQRLFYSKKWNNRRWRLLFKIFFSKFVMGRFGRDPAFLNEVEIPVGKFIFQKAEKHLQSKHCQDNYMLHYQLLGNYGDHLPHYLKEENYDKIRSNIDRLETLKGLAEDAIRDHGPFDAMNLSNIFEYMNEEIFSTVSHQLFNGLSKNGRLAYWNLMVPRKISSIFPDQLEHDDNISNLANEKDKGFFYQNFHLEVKK